VQNGGFDRNVNHQFGGDERDKQHNNYNSESHEPALTTGEYNVFACRQFFISLYIVGCQEHFSATFV